MKEIRMQPRVGNHDLQFKAKHVNEFLQEGNKVKVTIRFRGPQMRHPEIGRVVLDNVLEILDEINGAYSIDRKPLMEGRNMSMILSPKSK